MRISIRLVLIHFFADFQISFEMFFLIQQFPLNFFYYISPKFDYTYNKISKYNLLGRKEKQRRRKGITKFQLCRLAQEGSLPTKKYACCTQSHYREVPLWEIFLELELRFSLDLGLLAVLKKRVWADYEQLFRVVFPCFQWQKKLLNSF